MIGHEKEEKDCKEKRMDYEMIGRLQDEVCGHDLFECGNVRNAARDF